MAFKDAKSIFFWGGGRAPATLPVSETRPQWGGGYPFQHPALHSPHPTHLNGASILVPAAHELGPLPHLLILEPMFGSPVPTLLLMETIPDYGSGVHCMHTAKIVFPPGVQRYVRFNC